MNPQQQDSHTALVNPETSVSIQKRHHFTENLNSETSGDSITAYLHCGDVSRLGRGRPGARGVVQQVGLH